MSGSDSETEWDSSSRSSAAASEVKARQEAALHEILSAHTEEKQVNEEACRVCGEEWAEEPVDEDGNVKLDENGESLADEMVACDGCDW